MRRGEDFAHFFESPHLEDATVFCQFARIGSNGRQESKYSFETQIDLSGYWIRKSAMETDQLSPGTYQYDVLVKRNDPVWKTHVKNSIEYGGIIVIE
ncbi:hypothetical protein LEP1GSC126_0039 [Leptospira kirschneri str. 200801774]|uniref:hypothetical protein n=1 Tax=Leptospira kirschneri TaxID=29507 RepID=UPI0002BDCB96|nr:hypothetical protein LEP1GSC126_0039 [Leptospira kirschneri str. 200801774]